MTFYRGMLWSGKNSNTRFALVIPFIYKFYIILMYTTHGIYTADNCPASKRRKLQPSSPVKSSGDRNTGTVKRTGGKTRNVPLPQEYDLARFVQDIEELPSSWSTETPACEWEGVTCFKKVVAHVYARHSLEGFLQWDYFPRTVKWVNLSDNTLEGEIDFCTLPPPLYFFDLRYNCFSGRVDLTSLPQEMQELHLSDNEFSGPIDLSRLPISLVTLSLDQNEFSGEVDLSNIEDTGLAMLYLNENAELRGELDAEKMRERFDDVMWCGTQIRELQINEVN